MTRFTCFTDVELEVIEYAFHIAIDNSELDTLRQRSKNIIEEIRLEKRLREKAKEKIEKFKNEKKDSVNGLLDFGKQEKIKELHEDLVRLIRNEIKASNSHYGMATRSCDDDEKLVVLCMINKTLEDMQGTLEGIQETLARVDDEI